MEIDWQGGEAGNDSHVLRGVELKNALGVTQKLSLDLGKSTETMFYFNKR